MDVVAAYIDNDLRTLDAVLRDIRTKVLTVWAMEAAEEVRDYFALSLEVPPLPKFIQNRLNWMDELDLVPLYAPRYHEWYLLECSDLRYQRKLFRYIPGLESFAAREDQQYFTIKDVEEILPIVQHWVSPRAEVVVGLVPESRLRYLAYSRIIPAGLIPNLPNEGVDTNDEEWVYDEHANPSLLCGGAQLYPKKRLGKEQTATFRLCIRVP